MFTKDDLTRWALHSLALLRIVTGFLFLSHGVVKIFGFPDGAKPGAQAIASLLGAAGILELVLGSLMIIGLFTRPAAFIASGEMAIGYFLYHAPKSFFPALNMGESAIFFCFIFLYLAFAGGGAWSLDAKQLKLSREDPAQ